jgi:Domain of unknown function (DUF4124)
MASIRRIAVNLVLSVAVLAQAGQLPAAAVQKWTDANGEVHYGDAPPPGTSTERVRVNAPPPSRNPAPVVSTPAPSQQPAPLRSIADERQAHIDEVEKRNREGMAAMAAAQARTQTLNDKVLVDKCRSSRNSYCDEGVNAIRQKNYDHELSQQAAQQGAAMAQGRVIPPSQRIQPTAPCQWPQTCSSKK